MRTNASAAEKSTPLAALKSTTRYRIGSLDQLAPSRILRTAISTFEMVPKNRKPCSLMIRICRPASLRNEDWFGCRRTHDWTTSPFRMERMALRREERMTKETCRGSESISISSFNGKDQLRAHAGEDQADGETDRKVPDCHHSDDDPYGAVLKVGHPPVGVPQRLLDEVEAEDEDERGDDADRQVADDRGAGKQYSQRAEREHETRRSGRPAILVEEKRVDLSATLMSVL